MSIGAPLQAGEFPIHAFKLEETGMIEKAYFGDLQSRFYEISFSSNALPSAGVCSWFIESGERGAYFNVKILSQAKSEN